MITDSLVMLVVANVALAVMRSGLERPGKLTFFSDPIFFFIFKHVVFRPN